MVFVPAVVKLRYVPSAWRTLIAYRKGNRAVFLFGFAKNDLDNIGPVQLATFKLAADDVLALTAKQIDARLTDKSLAEVPYAEAI